MRANTRPRQLPGVVSASARSAVAVMDGQDHDRPAPALAP